MESKYDKSELKSWLEICLKAENLSEIIIQNISYLEKEGATGDIVFVNVQAQGSNGLIKTYDLVLKCSKNSKILRETSVTVPMFMNEIYFYENVLSAFHKFEKEKGIENLFNNIPKYYGSYIADEREVIALENVSKNGYSMWSRTIPMTENHINLVIKSYARFHAMSLAFRSQNPTRYDSLVEPLNRLFDSFEKMGNKVLDHFFGVIEETYELLQDDLDQNILLKWRKFGKSIQVSIFEKFKELQDFKVVSHGDCWNNNYMFQTDENNEELPTNVTILDWQIAKISTPVTDLAHFLFACISEKDIQKLDDILNEYYDHFSDTLTKLKTDRNVYTKKQFWREWKDYSRYGIMMVPITLKICLRDEETVVDVGEAAEKGNYAEAFSFDVGNKNLFKERIKPVVKYVVENNLV